MMGQTSTIDSKWCFDNGYGWEWTRSYDYEKYLWDLSVGLGKLPRWEIGTLSSDDTIAVFGLAYRLKNVDVVGLVRYLHPEERRKVAMFLVEKGGRDIQLDEFLQPVYTRKRLSRHPFSKRKKLSRHLVE